MVDTRSIGGDEFRGRIYDNILETIGATPLIRLHRMALEAGCKADIVGKCEFFNPLSSVKDRIGLAMITEAEERGDIAPGKTTLVEPTSGNTGIAVAMMCAQRGYKCVITMAEPFSVERRKLMRMLGAKVIVTPKKDKGTGIRGGGGGA